jgi:hypothetical protein
MHQPHQSLPLNTATILRPLPAARFIAASRSSVNPFGVDVAAAAPKAAETTAAQATALIPRRTAHWVRMVLSSFMMGVLVMWFLERF